MGIFRIISTGLLIEMGVKSELYDKVATSIVTLKKHEQRYAKLHNQTSKFINGFIEA